MGEVKALLKAASQITNLRNTRHTLRLVRILHRLVELLPGNAGDSLAEQKIDSVGMWELLSEFLDKILAIPLIPTVMPQSLGALMWHTPNQARAVYIMLVMQWKRRDNSLICWLPRPVFKIIMGQFLIKEAMGIATRIHHACLMSWEWAAYDECSEGVRGPVLSNTDPESALQWFGRCCQFYKGRTEELNRLIWLFGSLHNWEGSDGLHLTGDMWTFFENEGLVEIFEDTPDLYNQCFYECAVCLNAYHGRRKRMKH